jgi:hypothetical protein
VTERRTKADVDRLAEAMATVLAELDAAGEGPGAGGAGPSAEATGEGRGAGGATGRDRGEVAR